MGDFEAAQNHLSEALKLNASDGDLHERLGDVLLKRRLYEEASNNYETAFQIDNRNFGVAFKNATCLSIMGKDKEADELYSRIVTDASDEALMLKAAQRTIDDHTFHNTLDELAKSWMTLARSKQHKSLYLDILMQLAEAQAQPHILTMRTRGTQNLYSARYALKTLSETYNSVLVESLLSEDTALNARALELSAWLASPGVIQILSQKIENASPDESGRELQFKAMTAIAHAQSPAAIPIIKEFMQSKYSRPLREYAIWAMGLIQSPQAAAELVKALDLNFDSYRALAVIGLARQKSNIEQIRKLLTSDPSNLVKKTAAWALAYNRDTKSSKTIENVSSDQVLSPYMLWTLNQTQGKMAAEKTLTALWCGEGDSRNMAARLIRTPIQSEPVDLMMITQAEAQGIFQRNNRKSVYSSNFNFDMLLNHFADLETAQYESNSPDEWLTQNQETFVETVYKISQDRMDHWNNNQCKVQMLDDMTSPHHIVGFDYRNQSQLPILTQAAKRIEPQLKRWMSETEGNLSLLSLKATALIGSNQLLQDVIAVAKSDSSMSKRLQAMDTIAVYHTPQSQAAMRSLASDPHYLIRANAMQYLDPANAEDRTILQNAGKDPYLVVAETAKQRLTD